MFIYGVGWFVDESRNSVLLPEGVCVIVVLNYLFGWAEFVKAILCSHSHKKIYN